MKDADQLARLRVAAKTGVIPEDLARWVLWKLDPLSRHPRGERDELLRRAAECIPGTRWHKARVILDLLSMFRIYPGLAKAAVYHETSAAHWVQRAHRIDPFGPQSLRHVLRILD
ncbi:MAG: hypothetical protein IRZ28_21690 [Steroidobacteraceae bacterium]|nr:hypothetical protein [Steroidobacteraceae bacterium]